MNDKRLNAIGIALVDILGMDIKQIKDLADLCPWYSITEEQLEKMLTNELEMPCKVQSILCEHAVCQWEGLDSGFFDGKEFEIYRRFEKHLKWHLKNKRKHVQWQKRLQSMVDEYNDINGVE
jgi:hypothetical protein